MTKRLEYYEMKYPEIFKENYCREEDEIID